MPKRCKICGEEAFVYLPQHNLALCREHFVQRHERVVLDTIRKHRMFSKKDKVLVALSGGKDSVGLLWILKKHGFNVSALFIDLGMGAHQKRVNEVIDQVAQRTGVPVVRYSLKEHYGVDMPELFRRYRRRHPCSVCGTVKRYLINKLALEMGADAVATGHHLDDEVSVLLSNTLRWDDEYLRRQSLVLPKTHPKLVKKVKPLAFVTAAEMNTYAQAENLPHVEAPCPFSKGARLLAIKELLDKLEEVSPGTKLQFYRKFYPFKEKYLEDGKPPQLRECRVCGMPTTAEVCAFCRIMGKA